MIEKPYRLKNLERPQRYVFLQKTSRYHSFEQTSESYSKIPEQPLNIEEKKRSTLKLI